jgi:hypothetical protein
VERRLKPYRRKPLGERRATFNHIKRHTRQTGGSREEPFSVTSAFPRLLAQLGFHVLPIEIARKPYRRKPLGERRATFNHIKRHLRQTGGSREEPFSVNSAFPPLLAQLGFHVLPVEIARKPYRRKPLGERRATFQPSLRTPL